MEQQDTENEPETDQNPEIFELPEEILIKIIKYVNSPAELSLTCKKFYQLVCYSFRNEIPLRLCYKELCDTAIFNSVIWSARHFDELTLNFCNCQVITDIFFQRIVMLLKKYGSTIKKLTVWNSLQSKPTEMPQHMLYELLRHTPHIEEFIFRNIYISENIEVIGDELDLHKLRKLVLDYLLLNSARVLLKIPENVLNELTFTFEPYNENEFQEFFDRQRNIRKLEIFENDAISFDHLELDHLKISSNINFPLMIQHQPKLKYLDFAITWINDDTIEEVFKLQHLEVLKTLIDLISLRVFRGLSDLCTLKELRLDSHSSYDIGYLNELSMMRGLRLEKLTLLFSERKIHPDTVIEMANNFHFLRHIEIVNRSIAILDTFVQQFTHLESILLDFFAVFGAPEDILNIENDKPIVKLKQLVVTNVNVNEVENGRNLLKLVDLCPNLERLMLSKIVNFTNETFQNVLESHPKMTHFSIEVNEMDFDEESVKIIFNHGHSLKHVRLNGLSKCLNYKVLKEIFKEKFPILNQYKYSSGEIELIMRQRKVEDWHLNFRIMDHF